MGACTVACLACRVHATVDEYMSHRRCSTLLVRSQQQPEPHQAGILHGTGLVLQGPTRSVQQVDAPEGNGTGFVWDDKGHVVSASSSAGKLACLGPQKRAQIHATAVATAPSVSAC